MSGKNQQVAQDSALQMPRGSGSTTTPQVGTCHPAAVPVISVSLTTLDFGSCLAGGAVEKTFTITNTGNAELTGLAVTLAQGTGWTVRPVAGTTLPAGQTVTVTVAFTGQGGGKKDGRINIASNASNGAKSVALKAVVFDLKDPGPERYLASGSDDENYDIRYTIEGSGAVPEGTITVLDKDGAQVWTRPLTEAERASKAHKIAWKGQLAGTTYLTVVGSPYTLRVSINAPGAPAPKQVESRIKVEAHSVEIALGDKKHLQQDMDKAVYDQIVADGGLPTGTGLRKVYLPSNWFSIADDDKHIHDDSFAKYRDQWGGGPAIPLVATVWLKTSASAGKVNAPLALGTARVLWDFKDGPEDTSNLTSPVRTYVDDALNWNKDSTEPPGDNCGGSATAGSDFGGKRSDDGSARPVLLTPLNHTDPQRTAAQVLAANAYPFAAVRATTRRWAVLGEVVTTGALKGKSGILFQASRMAGDTFTVQAWIDLARELDRKGDLKPFVDQNAREKHPTDGTGVFQIWRELTVLKVFSKNGKNIHDHAKVLPYYEKAYVRLVDKTKGKPTNFEKSAYDTVFQTAIANVVKNTEDKRIFVDYAVKDPDHQFKDSKAALKVHPHDTFVSNYLDAQVTDTRVNNELLANAGAYAGLATPEEKKRAARTALRDAFHAGLETKGWTHRTNPNAEELYWDKCNAPAKTIAREACDRYMEPARVPGEGIVIFVFQWSASSWKLGFDGTRGMAIWPPQAPMTRVNSSRSGYMQFATHDFYNREYPDGTHDMSRTVAHELGHLLFLPHTQTETAAQDADAHDKADHTCIMGYNYNSRREFCGYCLLRLRGWDHTKLSGNPARVNGAKPRIAVSSPADQSATAVNATADQTITVTNNGRAPLIVGKVALDGADQDQFEIPKAHDQVSDQTIAAGASKTLRLTFKPTSAGTKAATLTIPSNDADSPAVISFNSAGQQPTLVGNAVAGFAGDFGQVPKDTTSEEKQLQLTNSGDPELVISKCELGGAFAGDFVLSTPPAMKLAKNASTNVGLKFKATSTKKPDADWQKTATLRIVSNAKDSPHVYTLRGTVHLEAKVAVENPPSAFGRVEVGKESTVHQVTLRSTGSSNLEVLGVSLLGTNPGEFQLRKLPPAGKIAHGQPVTFDVVFAPTSAGAKTARVNIAHNGPAADIQIDISGTGLQSPTLAVGAAPPVPATKQKTESAPMSITVQNTGDLDLTIRGVTSSNAREFLVRSTPNGPLAKNATGTIEVVFKPSSIGARSATLTIASNDPASPGTLSLTGNGTA